ncbi:Uroporphyrinogen decarboxylase [Planctomycetes bacterium Poly30]|uniref:Uroporphyrinogen decarboxylase n=1 Tax=Saltatorellus ferox TaxID=2528018 RepID=A0A518F0R0_9BACT|nr:Uroporphyrinogen decarboxylase [Planctomycetes bacterium Poly30]
MNSRQRFLAACRREETDRPPAWMMRQAGRYLPEYREVRSGSTFLGMVHDSDRAAEVTMQPIRRYGQDAAVIFCDILVPPAAMGMDVEFIEGQGPVLGPPIRNREAVDRLQDFDANDATGFLGDSIRKVRAELGDERAIIGFCGAPFTVASYMVEGQSSRNFENTKQMMLGDPETFDRLLTRVTDNSVGYLKMQADAGADVLQIFDSWGGALSAEVYRERLFPHVQRLVAEAKGFGVPAILYVNGCSHLLEVMADTGADVLGIDWRVNPAEAIARVGDRVALQGNLDPCTLFAPPDVVRREAAKNLDAFTDQRGYIFNLGSGILPKTPLESVAALWETVLGSPLPEAATA